MVRIVMCLAWLIVSLPVVGQSAQRLDRIVEQRVETAIASLADGGDPKTIAAELLALRDATALAADRRDFDSIAHAEAGLRIATLVATLGAGDDAKRLAALAVDQPVLIRRLVFALDAEHDDAASAAKLLLRLVDGAGANTVAEFGTLACAIAVVHDTPLRRDINENPVAAGDPTGLFGFFVANAKQAQIDPRRLPIDLLVFAVSSTEHTDQLEWARKRYRADRNHGRRFFDIKYDLEHYRTGSPKAVSMAPRYCLAAISEFGGVCADQAYFAEHVAKAVGVPSAYMTGRSGIVAHAWLGYLTLSRGGLVWDFNAGRYSAYQGVRGSTVDPQTGEHITDGEMAMRATVAMLPDDDRWRAIALRTVSESIARFNEQTAAAAVQAALEGEKAARWGIPEHRLELLEAGVAICPGDPKSWREFARLASTGAVSGAEIDRWLRAFERSGGQASADMLVDLLDLLIASVPTADARIEVLEWAFPKLRGRSDLQAWVRLRQGEVFEDESDKANAWRAYDDVVNRFLNDGPFSVDAVDRMLAMLDASERRGPDVDLLRRAFDSADAPFAVGSFRTQSNWYKLGERLAERLKLAGRTQEAKQITDEIAFEPLRRFGG